MKYLKPVTVPRAGSFGFVTSCVSGVLGGYALGHEF